MSTRDKGAACADVTWKLNVANWGLFIFAGMATHYCKDVGHRRCTALPFSMSFGPKEDLPNLYWSLKATLAFYEKHCSIKLKEFLSVVMWDATLAGKAAHRKVLPRTTAYARCLRHQLANAKETASSKCEGDADTKGVAKWLVVGSITFSAFNLWTLGLFHDHWEQVMARLYAMGQMDLVKWLKDHVLFWGCHQPEMGRPLAHRSHVQEAPWRIHLLASSPGVLARHAQGCLAHQYAPQAAINCHS